MPRKRVIMLTLLTVAGVVLGYGWWQHARLPPRVSASEFENDMTAGLMRGVLRELATNRPPAVCFLAFGEGQTPASEGFVARFRGSYPALRSSGSSVSPPIGQYFEVSNGRPGLIVRMVRLKQISSYSFDVVVAFSNLPEGRNRFLYRVSNQGGNWVITNRKPE